MHIIDKTEEIEAIARKHRNNPCREEAVAEACAVWGANCNGSGVLEDRRTEVIAMVGRCKAQVSFATSGNGVWHIGIWAETRISGNCYAPSVWDRIAYGSEQDARLAGVERLIAIFKRELGSENSCSSDANKREIRELLKRLDAEKTPQLTLF